MVSPSWPASRYRSTAGNWSQTVSSGTPGRRLISTYPHRIDPGLSTATGFRPGRQRQAGSCERGYSYAAGRAGSQRYRHASARPDAADPSALCAAPVAGGACRRRTARPGGRRGCCHGRWAPLPIREQAPVVPGRGYRVSISVSKRPSSCKNLVGATGFEPVTLACKANRGQDSVPAPGVSSSS
jgi:hypothetical protein